MLSFSLAKSHYTMAYSYLATVLLTGLIILQVQQSSCKTTKTKVLVLGAGSAGVGFANTLLENGVKDFLVLEAQNYIGGRLRETKFGNLTIQEGAGWLHDIGANNPFYVLKNKMGLKTTPDNYTDFVVKDMKGKVLSEAHDVYRNIKSKITKLETLNEKMDKNKEHDIPLKTAFQMVGWNPKTPLEKVIDFYMNDFENELPPWVLSAQQVGFTGETSDEIVTDQRGFAYILRELAKNFTSKIVLNTTVKSVSYNTTSVTVVTSNGDKYVADYVYVTFSTGVLGSSDVKFTPALPPWKMKAVYMLPMGYYTKIFIKFPTKFWDNNRYILLANENRGHYVHYHNLDRPGLFPGQKLLIVTVTGMESLRVEKLTNAQVKEEIMAMLRKVYPAATNATDIFVSRWSKNPTAYGAYSSPVIGTDKYTYLHLKAPVQKTLWFGGEAATDSDDFGYAHGAFRWGKKQGIQLVNCMKDASTCPVYEPRPAPATPSPTKKTTGAAAAAKADVFNAFLLIPFVLHKML